MAAPLADNPGLRWYILTQTTSAVVITYAQALCVVCGDVSRHLHPIPGQPPVPFYQITPFQELHSALAVRSAG